MERIISSGHRTQYSVPWKFLVLLTVTCELLGDQLRQVSPRSSEEIVLCWEGGPWERSSPVNLVWIPRELLPPHHVWQEFQDLRVQPREPAVHHEAHIIVSMCVKPAHAGSSLFQFGHFRVVLSHARLVRRQNPPCGGAPCGERARDGFLSGHHPSTFDSICNNGVGRSRFSLGSQCCM